MPAPIPTARRIEIMRAVSAGLAQGKPLTVICEALQASGRFTGQSLYNWLKDDPEAKFAIDYGRDLGHDMIAHECLAIADDRSDDVMYDADGTAHANGAAVLRAKLRIETRLRLLAKWGPTRYGDIKRVEVDGEVRQTTRHVLDPRMLDDTGRAALRHLIEHAQAQGLLTASEPEPIDAEYDEV
jgi:Bacteriophage Sf6, terminase small subunit-like